MQKNVLAAAVLAGCLAIQGFAIDPQSSSQGPLTTLTVVGDTAANKALAWL